MAQTLTVAQIAKRIKRPGESEKVTTDRIRNWTREGLLTVAGDKNPGTGRTRLYSKKALVEAALLVALVDSTGLGVAKLGPMLQEAKKHVVKNWPYAEGPILVLSRTAGSDEWQIASGDLKDLRSYLVDEDYDTHTVINLKRLFDRLLVEK